MRNTLNITFLTICSFLLLTNVANATLAIADTPCDSQYYDSLSARAWLEAQREITQNQNLILKPDSVFEYTCFDRMVRELAVHARNMLSETSSFGSPLDTSSMDNALQNLVGTSLVSYINSNYGSKTPVGSGYNLLSGHIAGTGINHAPRSILSGSAYSCNIMDRVWTAAKCMNFAHNAATDGFFTFSEYATAIVDKRHLPTPTACTPVTIAWTNNLTTALTSGPWTTDPVETYFELTTSPACTGSPCRCTTGSPATNSIPIPTGVRVQRSGYQLNEYDEKICLQPGCRYHPGGSDPINPAVSGSTAVEGCYAR